MKCPFCSHPDTQVVETREAEDGGFIRRRRQCGGCDKRFTTYERPEVSFPAIVKKDGRRIEYERAKLLGSFKIALRKRPVSTEQIDAAIERIEERLRNLGERWGGAITAGLFLGEFLSRKQSWAHLDIAGPAFTDKELPDSTVGGTGAGVLTLLRWLEGM